jgi:cobaltochelatase CobS
MTASVAPSLDQKIACAICGARTHAIQTHLKQEHPEMSLAQYQEKYPDQPILSAFAEQKIKEASQASAVAMAGAAPATVTPIHAASAPKFFHEVFGLNPKAGGAMSGQGKPIPCTVLPNAGPYAVMIPDADPHFVFDIENLKNCVMAMEINIPLYLWGLHGAGKTSLPLEVMARTMRPHIRVQHTIGMEERDVLGQWIVKGGQTVFAPGPLAQAMRYGWCYLADEYDYALPSVLGLYQPVLEGKSLVIKDACEEWRVVKPHPNFRFIATGNTNGSGDDTGLYQGTNMGNAANYDRFGLVIQVHYMEQAQESEILQKKTGIGKEDADTLVKFATSVREAYASSKISNTMSPRTLIVATKLGIRRSNWKTGVTLAFINKLSRIDREVVDGLAQRMLD